MILPVVTGATVIVTKLLKKNLEAIAGKTFNRFTTKDSNTWNNTCTAKSSAV
jgi:hypothetical protein